ncbi:MAG: hypothetical protein WD042_01365 [Phycisphaeraceae bacterium]
MRRRRIILALIVLLVIFITALITAEFVRRSDLPRSLVLARLEDQTGLHATASAVRVPWIGRATIRDLKLSLPLANQPLLSVPLLRTEQTDLWKIVLGRAVRISTVELHRPTLHIWEGADGRWNVQQVLALLAGHQDDTAAPAGGLPSITVRHAVVELTDRQGRKVTLNPVRIDGQTIGGAYAIALHAEQLLDIDARLQIGGDWAHQATFTLGNARAKFDPWLNHAGLSGAMAASGQWHGRVVEGALRGQLQLDHAAMGPASAHGALGVDLAGSTVTLHPQAFKVTPAPWFDQTIELRQGTVNLAAGKITADRLNVHALGGQATVHGWFDPATRTGDTRLAWYDLRIPAILRHSGHARVISTSQVPGQINVTANVDTQVHSPVGDWQAQATLRGSSAGIDPAQVTATIAQLQWHYGQRSAKMADLTATLAWRDGTLNLTSLDSPTDKTLTGQASWTPADNQWSIDVHGDHLPVQLAKPIDRRYALSARGQAGQFEVQRLVLQGQDLDVLASGTYQRGRATPLVADLQIHRRNVTVQPERAAALTLARLHARASVSGSLDPVALAFEGQVKAHDLRIAARVVQDNLTATMRGAADAEHATFSTTEAVALLGGRWEVRGQAPYGDGPVQVTVKAANAQIQSLAELYQSPVPLRGLLTGEVALLVPLNDQPPTVAGNVHLRDVAVMGYGIDRIQGRVALEGGTLALRELTAERDWERPSPSARGWPSPRGRVRGSAEENGAAESSNPSALSEHPPWSSGGPLTPPSGVSPRERGPERGRITGDIALNLASGQVDLALKARDWPVRYTAADATTPAVGDAAMVIDGQISAVLYPAMRQADGRVELAMRVTIGGADAGEVNLNGAFVKQLFHVEHLQGRMLGATVEGKGDIRLDQVAGSRFDLRIGKLDLAAASQFWPRLKGARGTLDARLSIESGADAPPGRAIQADLRVTGTDTAYGRIPVRRGQASAFVDLSNPDAIRLVLDKSTWDVGDGQVQLWGRLSPHQSARTGRETALYANVQLDRIDLPTVFANWSDRPDPPMGKVSGWAYAVVPLGQPEKTFGEARLSVTDSDLGHVPLFAALSDVFSLRLELGERKPTGVGSATAQIEGHRLRIMHFRYLNRGTEVRLSGYMDDLRQGGNSPIRGYALGAGRLLPDFPLIRDIDQALGTVQGGFSAVRVRGTLDQPRLQSVPLSQALEPVNVLIGGQDDE